MPDAHDRLSISTGDDPGAAGGMFEHVNACPADWAGVFVCRSWRPQPRCTCGRYQLLWDACLSEDVLPGHPPEEAP